MGQTAAYFLDQFIVGEKYESNTLSTLSWLKEVSNKRNAGSDELNELRSHIGESRLQTTQQTFQKNWTGKHLLEKAANSGKLCFFSERRIEKDVIDKMNELDLHDVLLV